MCLTKNNVFLSKNIKGTRLIGYLIIQLKISSNTEGYEDLKADLSMLLGPHGIASSVILDQIDDLLNSLLDLQDDCIVRLICVLNLKERTALSLIKGIFVNSNKQMTSPVGYYLKNNIQKELKKYK